MSSWPEPVAEPALHGPAGEFVQLIEPHTEADPIALLVQFLVSFGVAAGRHAHLRIEASHHYPNEFCVLVGASGKGRKGSSWDHVEALLAAADPEFVSGRLVSGLSSGEGLIAEVRDPLDENDTAAPADKRLLVLEPEFAQVMKVLAREGNTLSPVVRNGWDSKRLQALVRNAPLRASSAHVGIVAHITKDELLRYLNATALANGFFNRFLLAAVRRSKLLPFGGSLADQDLDRLKRTIAAALAHARSCGELSFDAQARERYSDIYEQLSAPQPGMFGAATGRAEAHTIRLALIYALLDRSQAITQAHLDAALALWRYVRDSTRWVFGDSLGDPTADDIWALAQERANGDSRTEVRDLFSRNKKAREIDRALTALVDAGRLRRHHGHDGTGPPPRSGSHCSKPADRNFRRFGRTSSARQTTTRPPTSMTCPARQTPANTGCNHTNPT